jgi:hypothetical protein
MSIRLELGRTDIAPKGDACHGYEFVAPLDRNDHLDAAEWASLKDKSGVRSFLPEHAERMGNLRYAGHGWHSEYYPSRMDDDESFSKLDRHIIAPGLHVTIAEKDGSQRPIQFSAIAGRRIRN